MPFAVPRSLSRPCNVWVTASTVTPVMVVVLVHNTLLRRPSTARSESGSETGASPCFSGCLFAQECTAQSASRRAGSVSVSSIDAGL
jgi:hypothetical protein